MSELPRTDDLPRTEEGYDPPRVEEAFASFGDRVRELETVAAELRAELRSLRAERAAVFAAPETDPDWPAEEGLDGGSRGASPDWVATAVPPPFQRPFTIPRLALEAIFVLLVALLAGLADLAPEWIALVTGVAWLLVALVEWSAAARRTRWRLDEIPPPAEPGGSGDTTGRWSSPVVEATAFAPPEVSESRTVVTKRPAGTEPVEAAAPAEDAEAREAPAAAAEDTEETEPGDAPEEQDEQPERPQRRGFFRRRVAAEPAALEEPEEPEEPEQPEQPEEPEEPDEPDEPDQPAEAPALPEQPEEPEQPAEAQALPELPELPEAAAGDIEETEPAGNLEDTGEGPAIPERRGLFRRRRNPEPAAPTDPWET